MRDGDIMLITRLMEFTDNDDDFNDEAGLGRVCGVASTDSTSANHETFGGRVARRGDGSGGG